MTDIHFAPAPVGDSGEASKASSHTADSAVAGRLGSATLEGSLQQTPDSTEARPGAVPVITEVPVETEANQTGHPSRRNLLLGGLGAIVSLGAGAVGFNAWNNGRNQQAGETTPKDPTAADAAAGILTVETSADILGVETNPLYKKLTASEKEVIDRLSGTPWGPAYFAYPRNEREMFAHFMLKGQQPYARKKVAESNQLERYIEPVRAAPTNTAQEVVNQWTTTYAEITWSMTRNGSSTVDPLKRDAALKMLFGIYSDDSLGEDDFLRKVDLTESQEAVDSNSDGYALTTAMESTPTKKPEGLRINFYYNGEYRQRQMTLAEFPSVAGLPAEMRWISVRSYTPQDPDYMQLS